MAVEALLTLCTLIRPLLGVAAVMDDEALAHPEALATLRAGVGLAASTMQEAPPEPTTSAAAAAAPTAPATSWAPARAPAACLRPASCASLPGQCWEAVVQQPSCNPARRAACVLCRCGWRQIRRSRLGRWGRDRVLHQQQAVTWGEGDTK